MTAPEPPCAECLHWTRLLITALDLAPDERRAAICELADHLPVHTERSVA